MDKEKTLAVVGESGGGKSTLARLVTVIEWTDGRAIEPSPAASREEGSP